jgi:cellulase/cellobiase CelA1
MAVNGPARSTSEAAGRPERPPGPARPGFFTRMRGGRLRGRWPVAAAGWGLAALVTAVSAIILAPHLRGSGGSAAPAPTHAQAPRVAPSPSAAIGCSATLMVTSSWATGFQASVTVHNNGPSPITNWEVTWAFPGDQTVVQLWNGNFTQTKAAVTVKSLGWNASPDASGSATFGFLGTGAAPTGVEGLRCATP